MAVFRMLTTTSQGLFDIQKKVGDKKAVFRWNSERYELEGDDPLPDVAR
jgi:hypothetical protein